MKISKLAIKSVFVAAVLALTACASMGDGTVAEKRQAILDMQDNALARLYSEKPDTRSQVKDAAGYAGHCNANINVFFVAAGTGYGVVNNNVNGAKTYEYGRRWCSLGLGAKDYRIVMVFHTKSDESLY